jgi:hypothetical protein
MSRTRSTPRPAGDPLHRLDEILGFVVDRVSGADLERRAHFSGEPAVTMIVTPNSLPSRIAVVPMPLVPPWTSSGLAGLRAAALEEVGPDGEEGLGQGRRLDHREAGRHRQALALGRDAILGIAAAGDERADRLALSRAPGDGAGDFEPGNGRRPRRRRVEAAALHHVGPVDPGRRDRISTSPGPGFRHRPLDRLQHFGPAGFGGSIAIMVSGHRGHCGHARRASRLA